MVLKMSGLEAIKVGQETTKNGKPFWKHFCTYDAGNEMKMVTVTCFGRQLTAEELEEGFEVGALNVFNGAVNVIAAVEAGEGADPFAGETGG